MKYKYFIIFLLFIFLSFQLSYASEDANQNNALLFHFQKNKITFNSTDLIKDYMNQSQYHLQVLNDGKPVGPSHKVLFRVNGVDYYRITDSNGIATLNINLNPGHYIVYSEFENYRNYNNILVLS